MGIDWPFADVEGVTHEIAQAVPMYDGLTWDALGDQGIQWDAAAVRAGPSYRKVTQPDLPDNSDRAFTLVTGTVLYDDGTLFYAHRANARHGLRAGRGPQPGRRRATRHRRGRSR